MSVNIFLCLLQAVLLFFSSISSYDSDLKKNADRKAMELTSVTDFSFDSMSSEEMKISEKEISRCREWYNNNILTTGTPAYDFSVGGKKFSKNIADWDISVGKESMTGEKYKGGKTSYITLQHKKSDLVAEVEATIYEAYATCEWTVYIKNTGEEKSPKIKNFHACDTTVDIGTSNIYFSKGSDCSPDDFEMMKSPVSSSDMVYTAFIGRNSLWMPYFNLSGKDEGVIVTNGWTGQWYSSFRQTKQGVRIIEKQESFEAYLTPGEQVRSPLVSMTFYSGSNPLKGFNTFRNWEMNCVYRNNFKCITCTVLAGEFDMSTDKQFIDRINSYDDYTCEKSDYLWKDAGWYKIKENWSDGVGNWTPDPARFPSGYAPVSEAAHNRGMGTLLWYEPERCTAGTEVYEECKKHKGWLFENGGSDAMVNIAVDECCEYLTEIIADSLESNMIDLYRQDFNFNPLHNWKTADKEIWDGRKGINENHYVTNLYKFLDTLLERNPELIIDNCASGGRRLDLEMSRRSIPLWRTDYNCSDAEGNLQEGTLEATQSMSYGISFWLPLTGTGVAGDGEYLRRTLITPCAQRVGFEDIRSYLDKNYYPLTYGARDLSKFMALQFGDEIEGTALVYKRAHVSEDKYTLILNGLNPDTMYSVTDYDNALMPFTKNGKELMTDGVTLEIQDTPKAVIILYKAINSEK